MSAGPILVAAVAANGVIGSRCAMPWRLPLELRHFFHTTKGRALVVGAKTWSHLPPRPGGRLPGRTCHVVATRGGLPEDDGRILTHATFEEALIAAGPDAAIIGGATVYRAAFAHHAWSEAVITRIEASPQGDAFFPEPRADAWRLVDVDAPVQEDGLTWRVERYRPR